MSGYQDPRDVREGKFFAAISYLSALCIISLWLKRDNWFARYHAKQGLVLFVAQVVTFIISIVPVIGWLIQYFGAVLFLAVAVWSIIQVLAGSCHRIPFVTEYADSITL